MEPNCRVPRVPGDSVKNPYVQRNNNCCAGTTQRRRVGLNLLDNLALDEVAATADKLKRWEFMLVVAPLRMENGAGSPVNVIATF